MALEKLPSGKWRGVVRHRGRKASTKAVATRAQASMLEAELMLELGATPATDSVSMGELLRMQLEQGNYSPTTFEDLERVVLRLPDAFLDRPANKVTPYVLDGLYRQLARDGWSPYRIRRVHEIVGASYRKRAIPFRWAVSNPARDVQPPVPHSAEIKPPTVKEVQRLLAAASGPLRVFLRLSSNTGARRGELLAIQWGDIELEQARVVIRRSVVHTPDTGLTVRETKTGRKGHRTIGIGPSVVADLLAHREDQLARAAEHRLPEPLWVFSLDAGVTPWRPDYVTLKFNRLRGSLGLDHVRLHDLRHFVATSMLSDGVPVSTVSKRLGHARASTTLDRYSHWMPALDADAADRLDSRLS